MLRSIKQICGDKLGASDGEIGRVKDFYFDDQRWAVRYVVADTGTWLPGRLVLISPHAFGSFPSSGKILPVHLTRKQIETSPSIDTHKPVSRQFEEEYYRHYGWPYYWEGDVLWGMSAFPNVPEDANPFSSRAAINNGAKPENADIHLRSTQAVTGYQIETGGEVVGHVEDFLMDERSWAICHLVVNTGNRFTGAKVLVSPGQIERISWEESKVFVNVSKEAMLERPASDARLAESSDALQPK